MQRAIWVVLAVLAPAHAWADSSQADHAAAEAEALAKSGDFAAAAAKFRAAWQADKRRPELFCNIGISYYKAKDLVRAHVLLEQCLQQAALDDTIASGVRGALRSVEDVLRTSGHTPVRFVVDPTATLVEVVEFAPDIAFVGPRVVWLPFGTYHVTAHAEGYADATIEVVLRSPQVRTVEIALRHPSTPAPIPVSVPAAKRSESALHSSPRRSAIAPIATTALTLVAAGVTAYAAVAGRSRATLAGSALDPSTFDADRQAVSRWNTAMVVAGSACAVGAIASGYLWYRALHTDETRVALHASGDEIGLAVAGQF